MQYDAGMLHTVQNESKWTETVHTFIQPCLKASIFMRPFACDLLITPGLLCVNRQVNVTEESWQKQRETGGNFSRQPHWQDTAVYTPRGLRQPIHL